MNQVNFNLILKPNRNLVKSPPEIRIYFAMMLKLILN